MKNEQQQQAKHLYFQSHLNKSQIADLIGVNRRTVMLWVQQGNWDRLKMSSMHMPSMVVEKCYYMLNHYLDNLMAANGTISTFGPKEAAAINQLATAIKKINNRSAVNESMELLSFFLDDVRKKDPAMADAIMPFAEQYIAKRSKTNLADLVPQGFNDQGFINQSDDDIMEQWLDEQEYAKMAEEERAAAAACHGDGVLVSSPNHEPPQEEEVLIKSFRDNCEETRVMRPVKGSTTPDVVTPNHTGKPDTNHDNDGHASGGATVSSPNGKPDKPTPLSVSSSNCGNAHGLPGINNYANRSQARKLTHDVEKQLTEHLKKQSTQNKTAA